MNLMNLNLVMNRKPAKSSLHPVSLAGTTAAVPAGFLYWMLDAGYWMPDDYESLI
jgi:hypothetical protein